MNDTIQFSKLCNSIYPIEIVHWIDMYKKCIDKYKNHSSERYKLNIPDEFSEFPMQDCVEWFNEYHKQLIQKNISLYIATKEYDWDAYELVGIAKCQRNNEICTIDHLFIKEDYRRQHIGTNFYNYIVENQRKEYTKTYMEIIPYYKNTIAKKFVESLGFYFWNITYRKHR